ncbi:MAG: O-antigen ligase family protein [Alphaproteobacteria bacterium]
MVILLALFLPVVAENFTFLQAQQLKQFLTRNRQNPFLIAVTGFLSWGVISLIWNEGAWTDFGHYARLIGVLSLGGACLWASRQATSETKLFISKIFLWGFLFYTLFYFVEIYGGNWVSKHCFNERNFYAERYLKGTVILIFLFWPAFFALKKFLKPCHFKWGAGFLALILIFILKKSRPDAALLAFLASGLVFLLSYRLKIISTLLAGFSILLLWVTPFLFWKILTPESLFNHLYLLKQSYQHRLQMWHGFGKFITEHPLIGHGFNATHKIQDRLSLCIAYKPGPVTTGHGEILNVTPYDWGNWVCHNSPVFGTHPHNGFIQIWFEFGLIGVLCLSFFIWFVMKSWATLEDNFLRSLGNAVFASYMVIWTVSFGIWQGWMVSLLFLTICLIICIKKLVPRNNCK